MDQHNFKIYGGQAAAFAGAALSMASVGISPVAVLVGGGAALLFSRALRPNPARAEAALLARMRKKNTELMPGDAPYERVARIAAAMGMDTPHVFLIPPALSNFNVMAITPHAGAARGVVLLPAQLYTATVPGRAPVLTPAEQDAVIAHELTHIKNDDSQKLMIGSMAETTALFGYVLGFAHLLLGVAAPGGGLSLALAGYTLALLANKFTSRQIEYRTDANAVAASKKPEALATALGKMYKSVLHLHAFAANASDITDDKTIGGAMVTFKGRRARPGVEHREPGGILGPVLRRVLSTHPDEDSRYAQIRAAAAAHGLPPMPAQRPDVPMDQYLRRTADDIILPPFAIPGTERRNEAHGKITVAIALSTAFNRAAAGDDDFDYGDDTPPPPRTGRGPRAPGPWG